MKKLLLLFILVSQISIAQTIKTSGVIHHSDEDRLMYSEVDSIRFVGVQGYKHYYLGNTWQHVSVYAYKPDQPVTARDHWPGANDGMKDTLYCTSVAHTKKSKGYVLVLKCKYLVREVKDGLFVYKTDRGTRVYPLAISNGSTWLHVESDWR